MSQNHYVERSKMDETCDADLLNSMPDFETWNAKTTRLLKSVCPVFALKEAKLIINDSIFPIKSIRLIGYLLLMPIISLIWFIYPNICYSSESDKYRKEAKTLELLNKSVEEYFNNEYIVSEEPTIYTDKQIHVEAKFTHISIYLEITNLTEVPIKINCNESVYMDNENKSYRCLLSDVKFDRVTIDNNNLFIESIKRCETVVSGAATVEDVAKIVEDAQPALDEFNMIAHHQKPLSPLEREMINKKDHEKRIVEMREICNKQMQVYNPESFAKSSPIQPSTMVGPKGKYSCCVIFPDFLEYLETSQFLIQYPLAGHNLHLDVDRIIKYVLAIEYKGKNKYITLTWKSVANPKYNGRKLEN